MLFLFLGRSNNTWLSPIGSANFSLQLHIPLDSPLGQTLSIVQHLIMVAVASAIKTTRGCTVSYVYMSYAEQLHGLDRVSKIVSISLGKVAGLLHKPKGISSNGHSSASMVF